jgi:hypothetical protein
LHAAQRTLLEFLLHLLHKVGGHNAARTRQLIAVLLGVVDLVSRQEMRAVLLDKCGMRAELAESKEQHEYTCVVLEDLKKNI